MDHGIHVILLVIFAVLLFTKDLPRKTVLRQENLHHARGWIRDHKAVH